MFLIKKMQAIAVPVSTSPQGDLHNAVGEALWFSLTSNILQIDDSTSNIVNQALALLLSKGLSAKDSTELLLCCANAFDDEGVELKSYLEKLQESDELHDALPSIGLIEMTLGNLPGCMRRNLRILSAKPESDDDMVLSREELLSSIGFDCEKSSETMYRVWELETVQFEHGYVYVAAQKGKKGSTVFRPVFPQISYDSLWFDGTPPILLPFLKNCKKLNYLWRSCPSLDEEDLEVLLRPCRPDWFMKLPAKLESSETSITYPVNSIDTDFKDLWCVKNKNGTHVLGRYGSDPGIVLLYSFENGTKYHKVSLPRYVPQSEIGELYRIAKPAIVFSKLLWSAFAVTGDLDAKVSLRSCLQTFATEFALNDLQKMAVELEPSVSFSANNLKDVTEHIFCKTIDSLELFQKNLLWPKDVLFCKRDDATCLMILSNEDCSKLKRCRGAGEVVTVQGFMQMPTEADCGTEVVPINSKVFVEPKTILTPTLCLPVWFCNKDSPAFDVIGGLLS